MDFFDLCKKSGVTDMRFSYAGKSLWFPDDYPADQRTIIESVMVSYDPSASPTLSEIKAAACARLNTKRDAIEYGVFTDSHGHRYDVDARGREKMTGLTAMLGATGVALPAGFTWTDADNMERPHNAETFLALTSEILTWTDAVHRAAVAAKGVVRSDTVTTPEQVAAIEAGVVWP